ncbi:peptide-N-glycosidase F-related protein [Flavobacteriales bacterium]|nr:peptide-N-glycosidase F-related protein [Flavobacteriales bacterium]
MRKLFYFLIALFLIIESVAQNPGDTIVVQTFIHNAWTDGAGNSTGSGARDTIAYFPNDPNLTFEKIIMSYNMRCKDNNNTNPGGNSRIGCGAWDYSCHTYIHDSTRIDSILSKQARYTISNFSGSNYVYSVSPIYNFYQYLQQTATVNSIISEDTIHLGSGADSLDFVIATDKNSHKSQFLYKANELAALGLLNDTINALSLNVLSGNQIANFLTIKLKLTSDSVLSNINPYINGFAEVYSANTLLNSGINRFQFTNDFVWDSVSNIIVEFSITNSINGSTTLIEGEQMSTTLGLFSNDANHITVNSAESIDLSTTAMSSISNEVTISFLINGNPNVLPQNTTILEAYDTNNYRTLNIHFPWSNGRMYWDCGNSGTSSYDRIDKAASLNEYTDEWSHWAFTKNATTGDLKIYRNGILWHSGTGHTKTIDIATLKLASNGNGNDYFWDGHIKELRIFDKELSMTTINDWMIKRIDNSHPDYSNLIAHYPLNEGQGITSLDNTINQQIATFNGNVNWNYSRGTEIGQFFTEVNYRPNINLYQGQYLITLTTDTILDSLIAGANTVTEYDIFPNYGTLQDDSIAAIFSNTLWEALSYLFDANGNVLSIDTTNIDGIISNSDLIYYKRYPMAFQIMSFVTPYGMGVDFGATGEAWYFDVTDYAPVLKGNKQITMSGGGQWQEDMDVKFLFIVGMPPRDILEMQQIWRPQSKGYGAIIANDAFEPRNVLMHPNASAYKLRTTITGHGQEGEFTPQNHYLNIDGGPQEYVWSVWTECAENPIYPQGGTWIYDRAGWCPGQASDMREDDITSLVTPGQIHNIDYGVSSAIGTSNYWVSSQLVSYGSPNHSLDAAVVDVLSPTNHILHVRTNPICSKPKIIIQNTGDTPLTSLRIEYWINGATTHEVYQWSGNLNFLEKEEVELPDPVSLWNAINFSDGVSLGQVTTYENSPNLNKFHVEISSPNGSSDGYSFNNNISSTFTPAPKYPNTFTFWSSTNSGAIGGLSETSWEISDNQGNPIYTGNNLLPNSTYKDTIILSDGCYALHVTDTDDDGLDFWANNDGGGMLRFRRMNPFIDTTSTPWVYLSWFKSFELDFGSYIHHEFTTSTTPLIINEESTSFFKIYPNPTTDKLIVEGNISEDGNLLLQDNLGRAIYSREIKFGSFRITLNMDKYTNGIYFLKVTSKDIDCVKKVVKQ